MESVSSAHPSHVKSPSPPTQRPTTTFSSLPIELRNQIWTSSFEPRTLSLYRHEQKLPVDDCRVQVWLYNFTARLGLHVDHLSTSDIKSNHSLNPQLTYQGKDILSEVSRIKAPPCPSILHACRESRAVALEHYSTFLPATISHPKYTNFTPEFNKSGYGDTHIWVNPKIDLIFLSHISRDIRGPYAPADLQYFKYAAPLEIEIFERIAMMIHNSEITLFYSIAWYKGVKDLLVYDTHRDLHRHGSRAVMGNTDNNVAKFLEKYLTEKKEVWEEEESKYLGYEPWVVDIPRIRVISDEIGWIRDENNKMVLVVKDGANRNPALYAI